MNNDSELLHGKAVRKLAEEFGTPLYVYDENLMEQAALRVLSFPTSFGLTVRFAIKACPTKAILQIFNRLGLHFDASSGFEVHRAILAGISPEKIRLTTQEVPDDLEDIVNKGVLFTASSIRQLRLYGKIFSGRNVAIRLNSGIGSGHSKKTNVGGPTASFGIWHENLGRALDMARRYDLKITCLHSHIGSGNDAGKWQEAARKSLEIAADIPEVDCLNLGGGFKIARMAAETDVHLGYVGETVDEDFREFHKNYGRRLRLEIEPGTFLIAKAGAIVAKIIDVTNTGKDGYRFIKTNTGMTEILRTCLYGAQHPIEIFPVKKNVAPQHVIVGHCCESSDILTPMLGEPDGVSTRFFCDPRAEDMLVIYGAGAYCSSMAAKNYCSFPEAAEVLIRKNGQFQLIRQRQCLDQMIANELNL